MSVLLITAEEATAAAIDIDGSDDCSDKEETADGDIDNVLKDEEQYQRFLQGKSPTPTRKGPYRYSTDDDISILKEVVLHKPFEKLSASKWKTIFGSCQIRVTDGEALRRRFKTLMQNYVKNNNKSLKGSGTEEDFDEKMQLLQNIKELMEMHEETEAEAENKKTKKGQTEQAQAAEIRDAALSTIKKGNSNPITDDVPSKKSKQSDFLEIMKKSEDRDHQLKLQAVENEKRRLDIQEMDFQLRKRELQNKELNDAHQREMDRRRLELEEQKAKSDTIKAEAEAEEKKMLLKLLANNLSKQT